MKTHPISISKLILPIALVVLGAASCATGPEGEPEGNGAALSSRGPGRGPGAFADQRVAELTAELGLSDEQAAQVRTIIEESAPDRERIHEGIAALLTPEQRERFAQRPVERRLQGLTERLGLDERQVPQVRAILQDAFAQMEQQRAQAPVGEGHHDAMAALHQQAREKIAALLTPEQRATFDEMPGGGPMFGPRGGGHHGRGGMGTRGQGGEGGGPGACGGGEGCPGACGGGGGGGGCPCGGGGEGCPGACGGGGGGGEGCPGACGGGEGCPGACGGMAAGN